MLTCSPFSWPTSVWSTVPRLCLLEKGYSDEEYSVKNVDISEFLALSNFSYLFPPLTIVAKGENFAPSYLK